MSSITLVETRLPLAPEQELKISPMDLATLIAEFIALGEFSANTVIAYKDDLGRFWDFSQGDLSDRCLMAFKVRVIMNDHTGQPRKPRSANRMLSSTKQFLDYLVHRRILATNIYANKFTGKGKKVDKTDSPYVALTDLEVRMMLDHTLVLGASAKRNDQMIVASSQRLSLVLGFYMGLRATEICSIRYESMQDGLLKVKGKGNKTRTLPITETVLNEINAHITLMATVGVTIEPKRHLIETRESQGHMPDSATVWRWFTGIARACGIEKHVSPHSARATAITKALDGGVGIRDVAIFAGHSDVNTTSIYDKRRGEAAQKTVEAIRY